jgi:hypothetical protein
VDAGLLGKLFGTESNWHGPCLVVLDAEATVSSMGPDSIVSGGGKQYAPRFPSGRINVDAICYSPENRALLLIQRHTTRQHTGEDLVKQTLLVVDISHVVGLQFEHTGILDFLEIPHPILPEQKKYAPGTLVG